MCRLKMMQTFYRHGFLELKSAEPNERNRQVY